MFVVPLGIVFFSLFFLLKQKNFFYIMFKSTVEFIFFVLFILKNGDFMKEFCGDSECGDIIYSFYATRRIKLIE